ncbi:MAG: glycoside hydrolase family 99-like domain-containing protein [Candidatus Kryptoniota bacterium]
MLLLSFEVSAQSSGDKDIRIGAYYFDGWTNITTQNFVYLTPALLRDSEREPVWGWITSTQSIVDSQIVVAAEAGIDFFCFDWYYLNGTSNIPLNHALGLYLNSPYKSRLRFCLNVVTSEPFLIAPNNWDAVTKEWLNLFKDPSYVTVDGNPLLIFFDVNGLIKAFGSGQAVREAFDSLRLKAKQEGLKGVTIAGCAFPNDMTWWDTSYTKERTISIAKSCGFDALTGYNYAGVAFTPGDTVTTSRPIERLLSGEIGVWNQFRNSGLPYIPVGTLNWDPRPWSVYEPPVIHYYVGYSASSVYNTIMYLYQWIKNNPNETTKEHIALLYAWNEYGEGGWLSPSKALGDSLLQGLKRALLQIRSRGTR